jgi:outer membrane immunogenic protein
MPFITGGLAVADIRAGQDGVLGTATDQWRAGWTIGGGVEAMFAPNWSAKIEYLYADFGTGAATSYTPVGGVNVGASERNVNVVRGGINYHFNWGGPVVARY